MTVDEQVMAPRDAHATSRDVRVGLLVDVGNTLFRILGVLCLHSDFAYSRL